MSNCRTRECHVQPRATHKTKRFVASSLLLTSVYFSVFFKEGALLNSILFSWVCRKFEMQLFDVHIVAPTAPLLCRVEVKKFITGIISGK